MKPNDNLHALISSMSRTEKRYFKMFASQKKGDKNYIHLFDAIDSLKEYNEDELRKKLKTHKFTQYLAASKYYLQGLIMRSLRNYYHSSYTIIEIHQLISDVIILFRKGLFEHSRKALEKAKKLCHDTENYPALLELLEWETRLLYIEKRVREAAVITTEEKQAIKDHKIIREGEALLAKVYACFQENDISKHNINQFNKSLITDFEDLEREKGSSSSFRFQELKLQALGTYYRYCNNIDLSYHARKELVCLMDSNPKYIREEPGRYITALLNLIIAQGMLNKKEEFYATQEKVNKSLDDLKIGDDARLRSTAFAQILITEINILEKSCEFDRAYVLIEDSRDLLKIHLDRLPLNTFHYLYLNFAYICFITEDYRNVLGWLNLILNTPESEINNRILLWARILNLLAHYELGNIDLLDSLVRSMYRSLRKTENLQKFEQILLNMFRHILKSGTIHERTFFKNIKSKLDMEGYGDQPGSFRLQDWLESKIIAKPFQLILREKLSQ